MDAAAIAAHYGSVSAVTFIAATNYLKAVNQPYESCATAFLAVMESPAILVGVVLGKLGKYAGLELGGATLLGVLAASASYIAAPAAIQEFANIQVEIIVPTAVAGPLLARLEKDFFARYAMVAYESDVRVLRPHKF